jgi:hypothetical protein
MATNETKGVQTVTSVQDLEKMKVAGLKELVKTFKAEDEENELLNSISAKAKKEELVIVLARHLGFDNPVEQPTEVDAWKDEQGQIDFFTPMENLAEQEPEVPTEGKVEEPEAPQEPQTESDPFNEDDILAELGLGGDSDIPEMKIDLPQEPVAGPNAPKEEKPKADKEKKPKKPRVTIPIDAPIPAVSFRGMLIGVYGNVLDELEEQDENGYLYYERKLERFNQRANESLRSTKGRMVIVGTSNGSTYLVVAEEKDKGMEPVIEVTNKGRGHLRCKQLANILQLAHSDKKDIEYVTHEAYTELKGKITPYVMVAEPETEDDVSGTEVEQTA